ncbi:MAG TPA: dodecin family protein [Egibacteraceae bacterium]|nr:dodecin family protein [Egibacteraceae bacterium]
MLWQPDDEGGDVTVLNTIELEGVSAESWRDAAQEALAEASRTLRNIRRMDILGTSAVVEGNDVTEYRTQVRLVFEVESVR